MAEPFSFMTQGSGTNIFMLFGAMLLVGLLGGELATRIRNVPRITGFIALGFILGPSVTNILNADLLVTSRVFVDIALAIILFKVATYIDINQIKQNLPLLWTSLAESCLTFVFIAGGLMLVGFATVPSLIAGAIGMSSSPAVILLVMRELKAKGRLTHFAVNLVALNNLLSFTMYIVLLPVLHVSNDASWVTILLQPLYSFAGALALGWLLARAAIYLMRWVGHNHDNVFPIFIGLIALALGIAEWLNFSMLLAVLAFGVFAFNQNKHDPEAQARIQEDLFVQGQLFYVLLFVSAGANLHFEELLHVGWLAVIFVALRFGAKMIGVVATAHRHQISWRSAAYAGLMLTPMAGLAIGLTQSTYNLYPEFSSDLTALILASVAILETVGPIVTEFALKKSGEVPADQTIGH